MDLIEKRLKLSELVENWRQKGERIGFVPTMGALHEGHLSLVRASNKDNDKTIVSIFVNPTQFNDPEDLKRYPRDTERDLRLLADTGCDVVFLPEVEEIYPDNSDSKNKKFEFGYIETVMEGAKRPGHFNGVGQVLSILFDIVRPDKSYFGQKDFQQIAIVKALLKQLPINIEIIPCPIVRESDGLAMSSRNALLEKDYRENAPHIYRTLQEATRLASSMDVDALKKWVIEKIDSNPFLQTEYFDIVDDTDLKSVSNWDEPNIKVGCIAVYAGKIRLIDNIIFA